MDWSHLVDVDILKNQIFINIDYVLKIANTDNFCHLYYAMTQLTHIAIHIEGVNKCLKAHIHGIQAHNKNKTFWKNV